MGVAAAVVAAVTRMVRQAVMAAEQDRHGRRDIGGIFADGDKRVAPADVVFSLTFGIRPLFRCR